MQISFSSSKLSINPIELSILNAIDPYIGGIFFLIGILRYVISSRLKGKREIIIGSILLILGLQ